MKQPKEQILKGKKMISQLKIESSRKKKSMLFGMIAPISDKKLAVIE
jgi:hypothetical protein